jgi:hypothetical protein
MLFDEYLVCYWYQNVTTFDKYLFDQRLTSLTASLKGIQYLVMFDQYLTSLTANL